MDEYKKNAKLFLSSAAFEDYAQTKKEIDEALKNFPQDWDDETIYEVQIIRRFKAEVSTTAILKEF